MVRVAQRFGGQHTELKLQVLMEYLAAYLSVMKQQRFQLSYIDAFAGTGWSSAGLRDDDARQSVFLQPPPPTKGSALRVFDVVTRRRGFDHYVFNDLRRTAVQQLNGELEVTFPDPETRPDIRVTRMRGDDLIEQECARLGKNDRAVMFLDPFGMQVSWSSIERIAQCKRVDLWYLAPVGGAYGRLMPKSGAVPEERCRLLDQALGGPGWRTLYRQLEPDMLGHSPSVRDAGWEAIASYFMQQWQGVFGSGALMTTLPLGHPGRLPFLLCFACSNPSKAAYTTALRIAGHLMENARSGRLI